VDLGKSSITVFEDIFRLMRRYGCRKIFDVGAGFGHFLKWASGKGIEGAGCDISEGAVKWGSRNLRVSLYEGTLADLNLPPSSVDCVVSIDTFYYVADPVAELHAMKRLLKPGGYIILRLRNGIGMLSRARREGSKPVGRSVMPSQHIWAFTPETIVRLLKLCRLEPRLCEPDAFSRTPLLPLHVAWVYAGRTGTALLSLPIVTRNFNIVAVRPD